MTRVLWAAPPPTHEATFGTSLLLCFSLHRALTAATQTVRHHTFVMAFSANGSLTDMLILKGRITHSEVSFFSSLSSLSCLLPGPDVCTPCEVTSGPRFCSELLLIEGEILGLLGLLLPPLELVLLPVSMIDSLGVESVFSLTTSLDFSPSRVLFSS